MKDQIESQLGEPLMWYNPENKKTCRMLVRMNIDLYDRDKWPQYHEWLRTKLDALRKIFGPIVKNLDADAVLTESDGVEV